MTPQNLPRVLQGTVVSLKEGYGFIQCAEREARMFFHFSERMDASRDMKIQDEVEFTVTQVIELNLILIDVCKHEHKEFLSIFLCYLISVLSICVSDYHIDYIYQID